MGWLTPEIKKLHDTYGTTEGNLAVEMIVGTETYLFNIMLPEESYLVPKIKWKKCTINSPLSTEITDVVGVDTSVVISFLEH